MYVAVIISYYGPSIKSHVYFTSRKATGATNDILVGLFCLDFLETMSVSQPKLFQTTVIGAQKWNAASMIVGY